MNKKWMRLIKKVLIVFVVIFTAIAIFFFIWTSRPYRASLGVKSYQVSNELYSYKSDKFLHFVPSSETYKGVIFYPGGLVEAEAYTPTCAKLAASGVLCIVVKMPFYLAIFDINSANRVMSEYPNVKEWSIGGHSLGGVAAVRFVQGNPDKIIGLFLLGSYSDVDISKFNIKVVALYGSNDMIFNKDNLLNNKQDLPSDTEYFEIQGGNHSIFGDYGLQAGDGTPTINREEQENIVVNRVLKLFN